MNKTTPFWTITFEKKYWIIVWLKSINSAEDYYFSKN